MMRGIIFIIGISLVFAIGFIAGKNSQDLSTDLEKTEVSVIATSTATSNGNVETVHLPWYQVVKVVDGDTIVVLMDGKNVTLRLIGLDTPETVDPRKTVQCFGKEASQKAKEILSGTSVRLEFDPSQGMLDKYGRTLAYVFLGDGTNFNKLMIAEGYGHEYTYNLPYKYMDEFKAAEKEAQGQKKGLWADDACTASLKLRSTSTANVETKASIGDTYECSRNEYNCSDFSTQAEAQAVFDACLPSEALLRSSEALREGEAKEGGGTVNDIHKLDSDGDGEACESLP